jgi:rhodanese-related sulfurtransferase
MAAERQNLPSYQENRTMTVSTITPTELAELIKQGRHIDLIDVRTPAEYREVHAEPARNVPLESLDPVAVQQHRGKDMQEPLYVICRSGSRGKTACEKIAAAGCENVINVAGGTMAWEQVGLAVVRGQKTISLERQVRIAAGSLVLVGSLLAFFVHPWFLALPAFVGAGLIFAGVTDTCGMAMILARMPWNQVRQEKQEQTACRIS